MSFEHDPTTGAKIYGPNGSVVWSSSREQAYWTDYVTGSFTIAALPLLSTGVIHKETRNIRAVSPNATHLMGWFTAAQSGGYNVGGVANGGTHQLSGTTILTVGQLNMHPGNISVPDVRYSTWVQGARPNVSLCIALSTYVSGGFFRADIERFSPTSGDFPTSWNALGTNTITITYHALALTFDN